MTSAEGLSWMVRQIERGPFKPVVGGFFHVARFLDGVQIAWARRSYTVPEEGATSPTFKGPGPLVIGATGGSGTRVLARAVRDAGCYIGDTMNLALDCTAFTGMWGRPFDPEILKGLSGRMLRPDELFGTSLPRYAARGTSPLSQAERSAMVDDLLRRLAWLLRNRPSPETPWGWKFPGSIHYVQLFNEVFPGMRFIHMVRDGRDMAFSRNQIQLSAHGETLLGADANGLPEPVRSAMLWNTMNMEAAVYGGEAMKDRYLIVRFEDLCADPERELSRIWGFIGFPAAISPEVAARSVSYRGLLGRWREHPDQELLREISARAEPGLRTFGYWSEESR